MPAFNRSPSDFETRQTLTLTHTLTLALIERERDMTLDAAITQQGLPYKDAKAPHDDGIHALFSPAFPVPSIL